MKKILIPILVLLLLLVVTMGICFKVEKGNTLESNTAELTLPIFIPEGRAQERKNYETLSNDVHTIWKYDLEAEEIAELEAELDNGIWTVPDEAEYEAVVSHFFTEELGSELSSVPPELQDDEGKYWCLYGDVAFVDTLNFGRVFIYDSVRGTYWCSHFEI